MNWRIAVIPATIIPIIIIAVQFDIKFEDVLAIGVVPFVLAVLAYFSMISTDALSLLPLFHIFFMFF